MELVRSPDFTTTLAASVNNNEALPASVTPAGLSFNSLGYIVLYDEEQVCVSRVHVPRLLHQAMLTFTFFSKK